MAKIIFVTGTDTGVGKTVVASLIARQFSDDGWNVAVVKPVETACEYAESGELLPADAIELKNASRTKQTIYEVCPYCFKQKLAPAVAAKKSGVSISPTELINHIQRQAQGADILIVEGAGGILVPIIDDYTYADLAADVDMPVLLVVGSKLGALNAASLSFEVLGIRKLPVLGYVFNDLFAGGEMDPEAIESNREALTQIASRYEIEEIAYFPKLQDDQGARSQQVQAEVLSLTKAIKSTICHD